MEPRSLADETFAERPPPQDPVGPWRFPTRTKAQAPVPFESEVDPILRYTRWREGQLLGERDRSAQMTDDLVSWLKTGQQPPGMEDRYADAMAGGGPIGTGAPGAMAGWVNIERNARTGLPFRVRGGPGPPQRALPPGEVQSPWAIEADVSGTPGGPLHVDYFRGATEATGPRAAAVGESRGGGLSTGKEVMGELAHHGKEGGYTGVDFWAIGSDMTPGERRLARESGLDRRPGIGNEGRLRVNEAYIGSKAVPRGGGHEIPFPDAEKMPPKPPWFESEPQPTRAQRQQFTPRRTPEEGERHRQMRLEESAFLDQEMQRLRRERVDPIDARRQAEALLEERRAGTPAPGYTSTGQARPPGPSRQESIERLHQAILQQHPGATISRGTLTSLVDDYRQTVGVSPLDVADLRDYALRAGHIDQAAMDRLLGPSAAHVEQAMTPGGPRHAVGDPNAQDASNLLESYRAQFRAQQGRHVGTFEELRRFAVDNGYVSPRAFDDTWSMAYGTGSLPHEPVRAPRTAAQQASSREAALARREEAAAREHRENPYRDVTTNQEALLRRVQERQGASMARETEQETRRALRGAGQTEMFRGTSPTRQARAANPEAPVEEQFFHEQQQQRAAASREPETLRARMIRTNREERGEGGLAEGQVDPAELAQHRRAGSLNRAETHNRVAQNLYATDDRAHFDRALLVAQQETTRLGRSLNDEEVQSILRNTRQTLRQPGRPDPMNPRVTMGENADAVDARHSDIEHLSTAAQDRVHDWARRFREAEGRFPTRADLAQYLDEQGWPYRHEGE